MCFPAGGTAQVDTQAVARDVQDAVASTLAAAFAVVKGSQNGSSAPSSGRHKN